jgi:hypothetical protein
MLAGVLGGAAVLLYQAQVSSTTRREVGQEQPHTVVEPPPHGGALRISTNPAGASLILDGKPLADHAPTTITGLALGEHQVRAELKGYREASQAVSLEREGETVAISLAMAKEEAVAVATLSVDSVPPGAEVLVDGKSVGRTPIAALERPAGRTVELEVSREGYHAKKQSVTLAEGPQRVTLELEKKSVAVATGPQFGVLVVTSEPAATVWEGPKDLGPTPLRLRIAAGRHQLVLANRTEGLEYAFSVVVKPEETVNRPFHFDRGEVQVVVKPVTLEATIYLRNKKLGSNPLPKFSLLEGEYQLTVVNEELKKTKRVPVNVKRGETTKVVVNLAED